MVVGLLHRDIVARLYEPGCEEGAPRGEEIWLYLALQNAVEQAGIARRESGFPDSIERRWGKLLRKVSIESLGEEERECVICTERFVEGGERAVMTRCRHVFGENCLRTWGVSCPLCRKKFEALEVLDMERVLHEDGDVLWWVGMLRGDYDEVRPGDLSPK